MHVWVELYCTKIVCTVHTPFPTTDQAQDGDASHNARQPPGHPTEAVWPGGDLHGQLRRRGGEGGFGAARAEFAASGGGGTTEIGEWATYTCTCMRGVILILICNYLAWMTDMPMELRPLLSEWCNLLCMWVACECG